MSNKLMNACDYLTRGQNVTCGWCHSPFGELHEVEISAKLQVSKTKKTEDIETSTDCGSSDDMEESEQENSVLQRCPRWVELVKPGSTRIVDFFLGLMQSEVSQDQADQFVEEILQWGGVFPKLAQRLRQNKNVVKSKVMRDRLSSVMEGCKSRTREEVCQHLLQYYQPPLKKEDVNFVKTLGTGSVAQVVLFTIHGQDKVMKMTWLEDKARFERDFDLFSWWLSAGDTLRMVLDHRVEDFLLFIRIALSKKHEILNEFDLTREANATTEGASLLEESWKELQLAVTKVGSQGDCGVLRKQIRVPAVKLHSPMLLEQEHARGDSLQHLLKSQNRACYAAHQIYCEVFVPLTGYMLMHKGMTHGDAHFGNLRYDHDNGTFWVIDWGAVVRLDAHRRQGLRRLVTELHLCEAFGFPDVEAEQAMLDLTDNKPMDLRVWMHAFNPRKNAMPQDLDYEELKESVSDDAQLILCLETILMLSVSLKNGAESAENAGCSYLGAKELNTASLLTYWATPASIELLLAVKNRDTDGVALAVSKGASPLAKFIDSDFSALCVACGMDTTSFANVMRKSWESFRPPQRLITDSVCECVERIGHKEAEAVQDYVGSLSLRILKKRRSVTQPYTKGLVMRAVSKAFSRANPSFAVESYVARMSFRSEERVHARQVACKAKQMKEHEAEQHRLREVAEQDRKRHQQEHERRRQEFERSMKEHEMYMRDFRQRRKEEQRRREEEQQKRVEEQELWVWKVFKGLVPKWQYQCNGYNQVQQEAQAELITL